ncbi:unnamed protein product [Pedinophyceae sp. YPF-701]|nr:unnamed protein product [Pedinophyceae sp. YPF-701]
MARSGADKRREICEAYVTALRSRDDIHVDAELIQQLRQHFSLLPTLYALEVNTGDLDVLNHKQLLDSARINSEAVCFLVRLVDAPTAVRGDHVSSYHQASPLSPGRLGDASQPARSGSALPKSMSTRSLPRPAFGSSPNLSAMAHASMGDENDSEQHQEPCFEITVATRDTPKLLSRLTQALGDLGLNIREAHAFNTKDKYCLDVFITDGWGLEALETLEDALAEKFSTFFSAEQGGGEQGRTLVLPVGPQGASGQLVAPPDGAVNRDRGVAVADALPVAERHEIHADWELDPRELKLVSIIGSGSFGDLYKGTYCSQEVAVKILKDVHEDLAQYQEFLQEVYIMRKIRHKNVVQFIGACTRKPNLCIVFEFMSGGSLFEYVRSHGPLSPSQVLKVGLEVARGMDYLHRMRIVHRDLKAANLLLDEHGTVKIADFGVARVLSTSGVMTAETGTYRWMAPEVIEHRPYSERADMFSFGILLWELLTAKVPYSDMTPLQAAVGVVQKGLRPVIPSSVPEGLANLMRDCWKTRADERPQFGELITRLNQLKDEIRSEEMEAEEAARAGQSRQVSGVGGLFSRFGKHKSASMRR